MDWSPMWLPWMTIRLPASGDVAMNYNPWTNWGVSSYEAGDPELEREIFTSVALPGKQLGKVTEAVQALVDIAGEVHTDLESKFPNEMRKIRDFEELNRKIEVKKGVLQKTLAGNAEDALDRLKSADHDAFEKIIKTEYARLDGETVADDQP